MSVLFVCLANWRRSRTAMELFRERFPEIEFDSCGVIKAFVENTKKEFPDAKVCTQELIDKHRTIICMDRIVHEWVKQNFNTTGHVLRCWSVADIFHYNSPTLKFELIQCLWS